MNFDLSDEQREIKDTARSFLSDRFKPAKVRELAEARSYDDDLTKQVAELGWPGIAIAEDNGGQGLGMVELAAICEEIGYACAPLPYLSSAGAALAIEAAGSGEQRSEWLPKLGSGEATGSFGRFNAGASGLFPDLPDADVIVVFGEDGLTLATPDELEIEPFESIDATRSYGKISGPGGEELSSEASRAAGERIAVAISAELTGIAQRAMEMAVDYAKERQQFGRPIGAYQAVSHRCAGMLLDAEESRSLTYYAAWAADAEPESLPLAAAMAMAKSSDAAWDVANASLQVHGGIGFTWEHDLQFWFKRARVSGGLLAGAREARDRVAELAGLGAAEPAAVA
jgi:alkylation response protein AidB-like acyl-CoA dehydrogenase